MVEISSLGLSTQSIFQIRDLQLQLGSLSSQLASGKKSLNYADYSLTDTARLLDFSSTISKRSGYMDVINAVQPRLKVYEKSIDAIDNLGQQALQLVNTTGTASVASSTAAGVQFQGFMDDVEYYLSQKLGERYLFSGSRYSTAPLQDLTSLPVPPVETTTVSSPTLPTYDSAAPGSSTAAYAEETATIDEGFTITYGVSSNDPAFQKIILGMRWAHAATQDSANFGTYMGRARDLLTSGLSGLRNLHGEVVSNYNRCNDMLTLHKNLITDLNTQVDDIQRADSAEVSTKITFLQSQLQASYSVISQVTTLSLAKYL